MDCIIRRKSIRSFEMRELDAAETEALFEYLSSLEVPKADIDWNFDFLPYTDMCAFLGSEPSPKAPHYLVLRAERRNFSLQNMGFVGALACLYLTGQGIGSCFMGGLSPQNEFEGVLPYVISIAVGYPAESFHEPGEERERVSLEKLVLGSTEGHVGRVLEAARYAPSAFNKQPVSYMSANGRINIFRKKVPLKWPPTSYVQCVDTGCAMGVIYAAALAEGCTARFTQLKPEPSWGSRIYQTTVSFERTVD